MDITLNWTKLTPISDISEDLECKGVYIWGFNIENNFYPYYVGIAENLFYRLMEHASNLIGGKYSIHHKNSLAEFASFKDDNYNNVTHKEKGLVYIPNWPYGYPSFLKKRGELLPHIDNMLEKLYFSVAKVEIADFDKKKLEILEKYCIQSIGKDNLWNTRGGNIEQINVTISGEPRVALKFKNNT